MKSGDLIQDRYLLEERLGKGGMGAVWRARDQRLNRTVGIKVMAPELTEEPEFLVRFLREAQSIARINHPNVVSVLDFGESHENPFLVMEYVPGKSLDELTGSPMDPKKATAIVAQAADAAGAAHAQAVVHRDIKPANILLTEEERVKLVDFGIASLENVDRITQTGTTIGSPHYISPEQATGEKATPRSDVYALGIVLFELLTGQRPFEGETIAAVAMAHVDEAARAPSELVPSVDPALDAIVLKALAKDPADRFADGRELSEALGPGTDARTMVVGAAAAEEAEDIGSKTLVMAPDRDILPHDSDDDDDESPWRAALVGLLIGFAILALALVAYAMLSGEDTPAGEQTPNDQPAERTPDAPQKEEPSAPTEEPVEGVEEPVSTPPTEEESPPPADEGEEGEDEEESDETIEGDVDVGENPGTGPDGEGPPGQEKKDEGE